MFAAVNFSFDPLLVALVIFAVIAALGTAHFLANQKKEDIRKRKADYAIAGMAKEGGAEHFEKYFAARASGDLFGALHQREELEKIAGSPEEVRRRADKVAVKWLEHESLDPKGRQHILHILKQHERLHHGDEVSAIDAAAIKILDSIKQTTTVDGKTVPTHVVEKHYYAPPGDAPKPEPVKTEEPKPATATHGPVTVNVHPAPPIPPTTSAAVAAAAPAPATVAA